MLLILLIGIAFFTLARMYKQNKFLYTAMGIGIALLSQFLVGLLYGIVVHPTKEELENSEVLINVLAGSFSIVVVIITYSLLKKKFQRQDDEEEKTINSFGVPDENQAL